MSRKKGERLIAENRLFQDLPENVRHIVEAYIVAAKKQSVLTRGWVFGSYAWGEPRKGSDIDLYLVVERRPESPEYSEHVAIAIARQAYLDGFGRYDVDLLVSYEDEFERYLEDEDSWEFRMVRDGVTLEKTIGEVLGEENANQREVRG